ncbi:MAG TPA: dihydropteroate synthase [Anaerolineales bacterium]|nr:dihydropteroate synthase [Anaerolineales bacterium]
MKHEKSSLQLSHHFDWSAQTYVMGILNLTPDSFSGDGILAQANPIKHALGQAEAFLQAGAHILDIGGESTRPGAQTLSVEDELARVLPAIQAVTDQYPSAILSIDTYKADVATAALQAGAHIVNDVWALRADARMASVVAEAGCPVVLMHNRSKPNELAVSQRLGGRYIGSEYDDLLGNIAAELLASVDLARQAGIADSQMILDIGIGFGKTVTQNLQLTRELSYFRKLGFPILYGPSRKSFIGYTLNLPVQERLEGTAASVALAIANGANIIRVHDVKEMVRVARMTDAILRA